MYVHCLFSRLSLYRGWFPVISSLCCSNFVYFYTFNTLKKLASAGPGRPGPARDLLMGVVSGEKTQDGQIMSNHWYFLPMSAAEL